MRQMLALLLILLATPLGAETRLQSACIALSQTDGQIVPVAYSDPVAKDALRIRYLGHASFALQTPGGILAITDYTGFIGNPDVVPDIVTMNIAHDTHFTDTPDPRIPLVLRGWGPPGEPARIDVDLGEMRVRNVTTDLRGPFGEGARRDGNSIFIFEVAGLCIGHLGHLHQVPSPAQYANIGRLDVVMVPVDGGYTMTADNMAEVVDHFRARLVIPMHWFSPEALTQFATNLQTRFEVQLADGPEITLSRETLPRRPTLLIMDPQLFP
jgi:L-ascorbate metabolism protein UlaG (beta-lactamase superfamily)